VLTPALRALPKPSCAGFFCSFHAIIRYESQSIRFSCNTRQFGRTRNSPRVILFTRLGYSIERGLVGFLIYPRMRSHPQSDSLDRQVLPYIATAGSRPISCDLSAVRPAPSNRPRETRLKIAVTGGYTRGKRIFRPRSSRWLCSRSFLVLCRTAPHRRFRTAVIAHDAKSSRRLRRQLRAALEYDPARMQMPDMRPVSPGSGGARDSGNQDHGDQGDEPPFSSHVRHHISLQEMAPRNGSKKLRLQETPPTLTGPSTSEILARRNSEVGGCCRIPQTSCSRHRRHIPQRWRTAPRQRVHLRSFVSIQKQASLPPSYRVKLPQISPKRSVNTSQRRALRICNRGPASPPSRYFEWYRGAGHSASAGCRGGCIR
jgi:hypothetical protein